MPFKKNRDARLVNDHINESSLKSVNKVKLNESECENAAAILLNTNKFFELFSQNFFWLICF
jgi:hypothetical protein